MTAQTEFDSIVKTSFAQTAGGDLTDETARQFFGALYEDEQGDSTDWASAVTPLVARMGNNVVQGDQALQSLMVNFVMKNAKSLEQAKGMSTALAGIKQMLVTEIMSEFPHASIEELISAARTAGYEVQVLS